MSSMSLSAALEAAMLTLPFDLPFVLPLLFLSRSALILSFDKTVIKEAKSLQSSVLMFAHAPRNTALSASMCPLVPSYGASFCCIMSPSFSKSALSFGMNASKEPSAGWFRPGGGLDAPLGPNESSAASRSAASSSFCLRILSAIAASMPSKFSSSSTFFAAAALRSASSLSRFSRSSIFFSSPVFSLGFAGGGTGMGFFVSSSIFDMS
mmetsp:Transcript_17498/g.35315  ORF Transcript_17498/g.35315 Transcript_17498/m.35315 type:complete len:209 (-) Transcript_17498:189-815(-)